MHTVSRPRPATAIIFFVISALYFADTLLRASLKAFWFDELFTVYLCRLPSFHATWTAVLHGCDFNPPLFYLLTRGSEHLFGEGLIATRLPAILGFYIFGVCLYLFASRRLGRLGGCVAALFPVFTLAHTYAYEARAHGAVLAACGLMLVCWQRVDEPSTTPAWKNLWLLGLSASFLAGLLIHVYAVYLIVPFAIAESYHFLRTRRLRPALIAAFLLPLLAIAPLYVHMLQTYRSLTPPALLTHPQQVVQHYLLSVFGGSLALLLIVISFSIWQSGHTPQQTTSPGTSTLSRTEIVLAFGFFILPLIGTVGVKLSHGPFFPRYFLASTVGFALLLAQLSVGRSGRSAVVRCVTGAMLLFLLGDIAYAFDAHLGRTDLMQVEPSSQFAFSASPTQPLNRDYALLLDKSDKTILVLDEPNYFYLFHYAPPQIQRRLVFGATSASDFHLASYGLLAQWANVALRTATYAEFFATHNDFLVYGSRTGRFNGICDDCLQQFLDAGYTLRSVQRDDDSLLEHFSR